MKKKFNRRRYIGVSLLLLVLWTALSGEYMSLSIDGVIEENWILSCFIQFLITIIIMTIIPCIFFLRNHERLEPKRGKIICAINSIALAIISFVVGYMMDGTTLFIGGLGALIFYFINKWLFVYYKDEPKDEHKIREKINEEKPIKETKFFEKRFCKHCGSKLNNDNVCTKCEKKYFKLKIPEVSPVVLIVLLTVSLLVNVFLTINNNKIRNEEPESEECPQSDFTTCWFKYSSEIMKAKFLDENIVFVIDGYGNNYYTYDCMKKITNGSEYSYWAYNKEQAIGKGYKAGSCD